MAGLPPGWVAGNHGSPRLLPECRTRPGPAVPVGANRRLAHAHRPGEGAHPEAEGGTREAVARPYAGGSAGWWIRIGFIKDNCW